MTTSPVNIDDAASSGMSSYVSLESLSLSVENSNSTLRELLAMDPGSGVIGIRANEVKASAVDLRRDARFLLELERQKNKKLSIPMVHTMSNLLDYMAESIGFLTSTLAFYRGKCEALVGEEGLKAIRDQVNSCMSESVEEFKSSLTRERDACVEFITGAVSREREATSENISSVVTDYHNSVKEDLNCVLEECKRSTESALGVVNAMDQCKKSMDVTRINVVNECKGVCEEVSKVRGSVEECVRVGVEGVRNSAMNNEVTYAKATRGNLIRGVRVEQRSSNRTVVVAPDKQNENWTAETTRKKVREIVKPSESGFQVVVSRRMHAKKGWELVLGSEEQATRLKQNPEMKAAGLKIIEPKGISPKVKLFDAPADLSEEQFLSCLVSQNFEVDRREEARAGIRIVRKFSGIHSDVCNYVLECAPAIRQKLMDCGRVFVDLHSCRVVDWLTPLRCNKCLAFGHVAKICKLKAGVCRKCGSEGHNAAVCVARALKCANCLRVGRLSDHSVTSPDCPSYKAALRVLIRSTNYA